MKSFWRINDVLLVWPILLVSFIKIAASTNNNARNLPSSSSRIWRSTPNKPYPPVTFSKDSIKQHKAILTRGGAQDHDDQDNERYSRQVYTLGARAHGLVRSCTVYVDGPSSSGLVYECVKNLALSGVGNVELWKSHEALDEHYHDESLDDLGQVYQRAAKSELNIQDDEKDETTLSERVLEEYIKRLNPSVHVTATTRPNSIEKTKTSESSRGVILCIDRPYQTQLKLNQFARKHNLAFVALETAGVYGRVFCDFGTTFEVYDMDGENPLVTPLDHIEVSKDEEKDQGEGIITVHCVDAERHDVSKGDQIQFQLSNGSMMSEHCTVVSVANPRKFKIRLDTYGETSDLQNFCARVNKDAASFSRIKVPTQLSFISLEEVMQKVDKWGELFTPCDFDKSFDEVRRNSIMSCFQALSQFVEKHQALPFSKDAIIFEKYVGDSLPETNNEGSHHIRNFLHGCAAKLTPLQAMFAAVGAQEALKAATGLYNPVKQILLYDCDELLESQKKHTSQSSDSGKNPPASSGLAYILGEGLEKRVKSKRLFVVGAGAIGCELLKNLAAMGFGTGKKGRITLTDMDTIEKSNLSRQLLFRDTDIGEFKSTAAKVAIHHFNPAVKMELHTSRVGEGDHGPFNDEFWSSNIDMVLNALDNMEARLFIDQQCVKNGKPLVDAGTLGSKGNVQVVVPHQSESYGSSVDPPEPAIPVCTLKNFPYAIAHTIQWGRDLFDGLYQRRPRQANDQDQSVGDLATALIREYGDAAAAEAAGELKEDLTFAAAAKSEPLAKIRQEAIYWAVTLATRLFHHAIVNLLREHPEDSLDEDGEPFWCGTRRVPKPLLFSASTTNLDAAQMEANENLIQFVKTAARLRIEMVTGPTKAALVTEEDAREALLNHQCTESSDDEESDAALSPDAAVRSKLNEIPQVDKKSLIPVEFEKDDELNGHVQFVTAASNLRAICYGIPPVNAMETRRVAGRIVPAMITTTAVVSALSCVELLKLLQGAPLARHRNAFINLALPFFAFTVPVPAEEMPGPQGKKYTVWDSIVIHDKKKSAESKGLTLKRFIKKIKKAVSDEPENLEVSMVSAGEFMIYANFLHEDDREMLRRPLTDLVAEAGKGDEEFRGRSEEGQDEGSKSVETHKEKLELTVTVEDTSTGEEFELPPVRISSVITPSEAR